MSTYAPLATPPRFARSSGWISPFRRRCSSLFLLHRPFAECALRRFVLVQPIPNCSCHSDDEPLVTLTCAQDIEVPLVSAASASSAQSSGSASPRPDTPVVDSDEEEEPSDDEGERPGSALQYASAMDQARAAGSIFDGKYIVEPSDTGQRALRGGCESHCELSNHSQTCTRITLASALRVW